MKEQLIFSKSKHDEVNQQFNIKRIPSHIAIITNGNGRWAQKRHPPWVAGRKQGVRTVEKIAIAASELGAKVLSLYVLSTKNWKRPSSGVSCLVQLPVRPFSTFIPDLVKHNVKVIVTGDIAQLPEAAQKAVKDAMADTAHCTGMILNFALDYESRDEITQATEEVTEGVRNGDLVLVDIDEASFGKYLMPARLGQSVDSDLLIRTNGEERISNFTLWQAAYNKLEFVPEYRPDFDEDSLRSAMTACQGRHQWSGGLKDQ